MSNDRNKGFLPVHFRCGEFLQTVMSAAAILLAGASSPALAQLGDAGCSALIARVEETAKGSPSLSADVAGTNWQSNAKCLMIYLDQMDAGTALSPSAIERLRVVAGALRAIIEVNAKDFRNVLAGASTYSSTRMLALAAASQEQQLRLNASFVLANIIDPRITCVVVDQLADPDLPKSPTGRNGRANLLGTLRAMANWADPYTRALMRDALDASAAQIVGETDVQATTSLIADVRTRLNTPIRNALTKSDNCSDYKVRYARRAFDNANALKDPITKSLSLNASTANEGITSLAELATTPNSSAAIAATAREAIWPLTRGSSLDVNNHARQSIKQAFCYQERDTARDNAGRFLIICHPTVELCERTRGPNKRDTVRQTPCATVQRDTGFAELQGGGFDGALYRYSTGAFAAPYPVLND